VGQSCSEERHPLEQRSNRRTWGIDRLQTYPERSPDVASPTDPKNIVEK
jgi:hypothetical protein